MGADLLFFERPVSGKSFCKSDQLLWVGTARSPKAGPDVQDPVGPVLGRAPGLRGCCGHTRRHLSNGCSRSELPLRQPAATDSDQPGPDLHMVAGRSAAVTDGGVPSVDSC
jgi:hypothetical protein